MGIASDLDGAYMISDIPIGTYTLLAMFIGYENLENKIRVEANQKYIINISLNPVAIEIQETKVTAEKRKEKVTGAPASMEIVSSREIKGKTTTNMGAYLKGLKGVDFTSSGINNYSISVRGFNSSFNTRLLTLSDGRVANIPALRVINYSSIPQSMDDVDKIEIILGPATALYGANAHSGVVNIVSKPPSQSEGFTMSISGSHDDRQLRKINGRFAKKISKTLSMKVSGLYLHAYDWQFISEEEYKAHRYPWVLTPARTNDGKDNNPWNNVWGESLTEYEQINTVEKNGKTYIIGNGEAMDTGDPDGDGVMGEDWWNGYDDDGDCLILGQAGDSNGDGCICCSGDDGVDEDYFIADGIDNNGDGRIDENIDNVHDLAYDGIDNDHDGIIDNEAGDGVIQNVVKEWGGNIDNNVLRIDARKDSLLKNGKINPYWCPTCDWQNNGDDLLGNHRYIEEEVRLEYDIFTYDYGKDGIPGDNFTDLAGDTKVQLGEYSADGNSTFSDIGLDGIASIDLNGDGLYNLEGEIAPDEGEGDGIWQPGDGWVDDGDGIIELLEDNYKWKYNVFGGKYIECPCGFIEGTTEDYLGTGLIVGNCATNCTDAEYNDVWPPKDGIFNPETESYYDYGQDGLPNTGDPGENDGRIVPIDTKELDFIFDTGDGLFGFTIGEPFTDEDGDGVFDPGRESYDDYGQDGLPNTGDPGEGDGQYNYADFVDDYQLVSDTNGDQLHDYPDFEIDNRKIEFRLDYDPNPDFNMTLQSGYSTTKTQQVTGTGRYLADGFEYTFYQLRSRYKNWFSQIYMNATDAGNTRGYNLGNRITDKSKNYAVQLQNNFSIQSLHTNFVWGMDYFRTEPFTNGSILNDGPNGYDNDGDFVISWNDGIDNDQDGLIDDDICLDGKSSQVRDGKLWECYEGIDEPDEFIDPTSNELGMYYQSTTELFGTSRYQLITAARLDYHDLLDEGVLFAPKLGFIYKPDDKSSMRFTYGRAFNTPNSISLFTDLAIGVQNGLEVYLRGNYKGNDYCRVGQPCLGENYPTSIAEPGFYSENGEEFYLLGPPGEITNYFEGYEERVLNAPYFFKWSGDDLQVGDNIPLDTSRNLIYVPDLNGDGILFNPLESFNIPNIEPIKTEKIQTIEFGYKGFLGYRTHISFDYYLSYYEDFFSPPTIITPLVVARMFDNDGNDITNIDDLSIQGIMTINEIATYPPYATGYNGLDDDGDWEEWAIHFGWDTDDKNNDCPNGANSADPCWADPGEWGYILPEDASYHYGCDPGIQVDCSGVCGGNDWSCSTTQNETGRLIFHPYEILLNKTGYPTNNVSGNNPAGQLVDSLNTQVTTVGVDEFMFGGLREHEIVLGADGEPITDSQDGIVEIGVASAPYHLVLSPMNYGEVWMQGLDIGMTHFFSENLIFNGNVSWYGTTDFYNELTRKNDPINAPEWKWNASMKWNTSFGDIILNYRHVNQFQWSDGIWSGMIGPYDILDLFYTYHITKNLDFNVSALNVNNDLHKELVGGAVMGRQIVMRFTSTF